MKKTLIAAAVTTLSMSFAIQAQARDYIAVDRRLLELSLTALADSDIDQALDVFREEGELEEEFDAAMRHLMTFVFEDAALLGQVIDVVFALRALVTIGDKASNIAEQVIFVAKGTDVRYRNKEILIASLSQEGIASPDSAPPGLITGDTNPKGTEG